MQMLNAIEVRLIGCLIEKAVTTPDQYPLSLNSLTTACNQKSNREPVMDLSESEVQEAVDSLVVKNLISEVRFGGRVPKYQHRFGVSEFAEVRFNDRQIALLCVLFLRGPQTPGELRTRTARLAEFADVNQVESLLAALAQHDAGPFVERLEREPGKREHRWVHLFAEHNHVADRSEGSEFASSAEMGALSSSNSPNNPSPSLFARVASLEQEVSELRASLESMRSQLADLLES